MSGVTQGLDNDLISLTFVSLEHVEHGSFTPLVLTTTGGMGKEYIRYYSRLAELIAAK